MAIYYNYQNGSRVWQGWNSAIGSAGGGIVSAPTVLIQNGIFVVFATAANGNIYYNYQNGSGVWQGWNSAIGSAGGGIVSAPTVLIQNGIFVAFATAADSAIYYNYQNGSGVWQGWNTAIGKPPVGQPLVCTTKPATVSGPGGSGSASFWYLGGAPSTGSYAVSTTLTIAPPASSCVNPTISWSTDSPTRLSLSPSANGLSATLTSLGASVYQAGYDIHVTVTYNGNSSSSFPVFINTPYTMTTNIAAETFCSNGLCGCAIYQNANPPDTGYILQINHGVADLNGNVLTPIVSNESLEKQTWLNSSYQTTIGNNPMKSGAWSPSPRRHNDASLQ